MSVLSLGERVVFSVLPLLGLPYELHVYAYRYRSTITDWTLPYVAYKSACRDIEVNFRCTYANIVERKIIAISHILFKD